MLAKDVSALDQLEFVRRMNTEWSDNSVSCTVYYRPDELDDIRDYLADRYNENFKSLSFLLHQDHGFDQAPLEEISKERYDEIVANTRPIVSTELTTYLEMGDDECVIVTGKQIGRASCRERVLRLV